MQLRISPDPGAPAAGRGRGAAGGALQGQKCSERLDEGQGRRVPPPHAPAPSLPVLRARLLRNRHPLRHNPVLRRGGRRRVHGGGGRRHGAGHPLRVHRRGHEQVLGAPRLGCRADALQPCLLAPVVARLPTHPGAVPLPAQGQRGPRGLHVPALRQPLGPHLDRLPPRRLRREQRGHVDPAALRRRVRARRGGGRRGELRGPACGPDLDHAPP
mmetsp:Transcript_97651/g.291639  ORF Transcript_97651/g.291639 Transcript_97651/m.291639 type:complete len:214 (-) Transcript_97651:262-903(-)